MAGDEGPGILDIEAALEHGLEKVAKLPQHTQDSAQQNHVTPRKFLKEKDFGQPRPDKGSGHSPQSPFYTFIRADSGIEFASTES